MTYIIQKKGFTLIETLIAIAIIMIAITGPFAATENSIDAANISRDKTIAVFLAQEGIEYVRAVRDKVYIKECFSNNGINCSEWWNAFTTNTTALSNGYNILQCGASKSCSFDGTKVKYNSNIAPFTNGALNVCLAIGNCGKLFISSSGTYTTVSGTPTPFTRIITTTPITSTILSTTVSVISVKVTVTFKEHGTNYTVTANDIFTPWE